MFFIANNLERWFNFPRKSCYHKDLMDVHCASQFDWWFEKSEWPNWSCGRKWLVIWKQIRIENIWRTLFWNLWRYFVSFCTKWFIWVICNFLSQNFLVWFGHRWNRWTTHFFFVSNLWVAVSDLFSACLFAGRQRVGNVFGWPSDRLKEDWKKDLTFTLLKLNIAPENEPSQKETSIPTIHFQVLC